MSQDDHPEFGEIAGPYRFPASCFPIHFEAFGKESGEKLWEKTIEMPENGLLEGVQIPALAKAHGEEVTIHITWGDGRESWSR